MRGGDEFCSRICCGLDMHTADFAALPPRINVECERTAGIPWESFVPNYAQYPHNFKPVISYLVASVCHWCRAKFPQANFADSHPFWASQFWRGDWCNRIYGEECDGILTGILHCRTDGMRATGIPAQVRLGIDFSEVSKRVDLLANTVETFVGGTRESLLEELWIRIDRKIDDCLAPIKEVLTQVIR